MAWHGALLLCGFGLVASACSPSSPPSKTTPAAVSTTSSTSASAPIPTSLSALVDPLVGTGVGGTSVGSIDTFPGADVPFGMMQWSPDTSPDRASGGGYSYKDSV